MHVQGPEARAGMFWQDLHGFCRPIGAIGLVEGREAGDIQQLHADFVARSRGKAAACQLPHGEAGC